MKLASYLCSRRSRACSCGACAQIPVYENFNLFSPGIRADYRDRELDRAGQAVERLVKRGTELILITKPTTDPEEFVRRFGGGGDRDAG